MDFLSFGYYIVEPVPTPVYFSLKSDCIISASECICNFHPSLEGSFWLNHDEKQLEYQNKLKISDDTFKMMKAIVSDLYNGNRLDSDGRFANYTDAVDFYREYLNSLNGIKIIALALNSEFRDVLYDELGSYSNISSVLESPQLVGDFVGYEILGWDCGSFHSYLCNGFDKDISETYELVVNDFGTIQNSYAAVKEFVRCLEDKNGEPVVWLPFAIYECPA